ncbi:MAG: glucose-1-phosphate adenylyltransferase subunit GlgD [Lachnospiraceae bacterium]|jgi:glucose-1-phosphate adenylyltransferase|nr:glucose-1-phosphate adenylyltransferase subunit GlgD [Lachnospiraceae bacterium]
MKAVGIILAGGGSSRLESLTAKRAVAAMPLAGTYRSIDFSLSNMSNSGVGTVAVVTQYSSRSLNIHLSSSKWWDFGRKQGGLYLLNPTITPENTHWYRGTADALIQNLDFIKERHEPYVIIASGDGVYKLDYNEVLERHAATGAEMTIVCKRMPKAESERFGVLQLDGDGRIVSWAEKDEHSSPNEQIINCGIYVIRRRHLIQLLEEAAREDKCHLVTEMIIPHLAERKIMAYMLETYWTNIASVKAYFDCNKDFLDPKLRSFFFSEHPVIHTKVDDNPPAKFNGSARVSNSLVAGGGIVNGTVADSVLFKKVYVGDRSNVKNCILMDDVYVGDDVVLENCIVDKKTRIANGTRMVGDPDHIPILS